MMIESNYEINISYHDVHYCRVELGNCMPLVAGEKTKTFRERFSEEEGFKVTLNKIECHSIMEN